MATRGTRGTRGAGRGARNIQPAIAAAAQLAITTAAPQAGVAIDPKDLERLGPAEKIINALLLHTDHLYHNRPGVIVPDNRFNIGVKWSFVTHKMEGPEGNQQAVVYSLTETKVGKKTRVNKTRLGILDKATNRITEANKLVGEYRPAGIFPEVAAWFYSQIADIWKMDNDFAAKWASYAFSQDHRDLKILLAAFMLVQNRKGDPIKDGDEVFYDSDHRDVGEAMMLIHRKDGKDLNPKLLLRIHEILNLPAIADINRTLGFGVSTRKPFFGRWTKVVEKWLRYREENIKSLEGLVKGGFRTTVMELARRVGYKPISNRFFQILRWKQNQADDGRRSIAIGEALAAAESWQGLTETQICEKITTDKLNWKRIQSLLPSGVTRAIMAAAIESGSLSEKDLIIYTPTIEDLGLLEVTEIKSKWEKAIKNAEDMRAANIAKNVKTAVVKEKLIEAADNAIATAIEKVTRDLRTYFFVDISGSMHHSIPEAKKILAKFLQGFPVDRTHVCCFSTIGKEIKIVRNSAAGIDAAFKGISPGGGTSHASGIRCLEGYKPKDNEDVLFMFVGDEGERATFETTVINSGLRPTAFGLVRLAGENFNGVTNTAIKLGIPCFLVNNETFDDPYAVTRTISTLISSTPVGAAPKQMAQAPKRQSLIEIVLATPLLTKPAWA